MYYLIHDAVVNLMFVVCKPKVLQFMYLAHNEHNPESTELTSLICFIIVRVLFGWLLLVFLIYVFVDGLPVSSQGQHCHKLPQ